jgi:hypothetical protein
MLVISPQAMSLDTQRLWRNKGKTIKYTAFIFKMHLRFVNKDSPSNNDEVVGTGSRKKDLDLQ